MIKVKDSFAGWMVRRLSTTTIDIAHYRVPKASKEYLISNKFVTRSFSKEFLFHQDMRTELRRFYKIILVNLRKRLPILKAGNEVYSLQFATIRLRYSSLDINSLVKPTVVIRYFRRIGVYDFISRANIPIHITVEPDGVNTRIRCEPSESASNLSWLGSHLLIFSLPVLLRLLGTIHRKAHFCETTLTTLNTGVEDDNIPF